MVYLEAMACGLPVIACEGSGASEVVIHQNNGLLVPPEDVNSLINALRLFLGDSKEREEMGRRAREFVLSEADSKVCLRKIEAFYNKVASGGYKGVKNQ